MCSTSNFSSDAAPIIWQLNDLEEDRTSLRAPVKDFVLPETTLFDPVRAFPALSTGNVTAIIPARGGSKGIPRKNAKLLCGKPLVAYSIEAALKSRLISNVVVSTDDDEIAGIAREYRPDMPMARPEDLASDSARLDHVVAHVINSLKMQGNAPDFVVILHPTSPFRNPRLLDFLVDKGLYGHSPVLTMKSIPDHLRLFIVNRGGNPALLGNGPCGITSRMRFYGLFSGSRGFGISPSPYLHLVENEIQLIDIDYPEQFRLAEQIIKNRLFDFDLR